MLNMNLFSFLYLIFNRNYSSRPSEGSKLERIYALIRFSMFWPWIEVIAKPLQPYHLVWYNSIKLRYADGCDVMLIMLAMMMRFDANRIDNDVFHVEHISPLLLIQFKLIVMSCVCVRLIVSYNGGYNVEKMYILQINRKSRERKDVLQRWIECIAFHV